MRPSISGDAGKGDADLTVSVDVVEHLGGTSFLYARSTTGDELVSQRDAEAVDPTEVTVSIRKSYLFDKKGLRQR